MDIPFIYKYRPKTLDEFSFHEDVIIQLKCTWEKLT